MPTLHTSSIRQAPQHPGALLGEILEAGNFPYSKAEVARALGISRRTLYNLVAGDQGVTAEMATRLAAAFRNDPRFWLQLQAEYDLAIAAAELAGALDRIPVLLPKAA